LGGHFSPPGVDSIAHRPNGRSDPSLIVYFEIGPLKEREYTGIAQVAAALSQELIGDPEVDSRFFYGGMIVPKPLVESLLRTRTGELLEWYLKRTAPRPAPEDLSPANVAVFPNRKTARRTFGKECQIIHDLSTLLTPQFHHPDTIEFHATSLEQDMLSNDITFCVSDATRSDVLAYFPALAPETVHTMPLAASLDGSAESGFAAPVERYILVLGTIEPRKNASLVLRYLAAHPAFSKLYRMVFVGRFGWGSSVEQLLEEFGLAEQYAAGRIVFLGFVTEHTKHALILNAQLLVYPSLFEGFGLPLLEAAALGVPSVTTRASSLPEAGGPHAYYFDPFIDGDFGRALMQALVDLEVDGPAVRRRCREWGRQFSWDKTYGIMKSRIQGLFAAREH
jgi:glycosyltransferase involved in cell wall biosynthesis